MGSQTIPDITSPFFSNAIEIAKCGIPCIKFEVPSIGSMTQLNSLSFFLSPDSSAIKPYLGLAFSSSSIMIFSTFLSVLVTKSPGPFLETCNFSTSPKSRIITLLTLSQIFSKTFISAERRGIS